MDNRQNVQLNVRVTRDLKDRLDKYATKNKVTRNEVVRAATNAYINAQPEHQVERIHADQ